MDGTTEHRDAGERCLAGHYASDYRTPTLLPPCIRCVCGAWVRPEDWAAHVAAARIPAAPRDGA